jgi:hypothetical protein
LVRLLAVAEHWRAAHSAAQPWRERRRVLANDRIHLTQLVFASAGGEKVLLSRA